MLNCKLTCFCGKKMAGTIPELTIQPLCMQDQPEPEMRYVYVGLHADGPTRVLCFSDRKDQYTQGTNEDHMAVLAAKLGRLEARLKVTLS